MCGTLGQVGYRCTFHDDFVRTFDSRVVLNTQGGSGVALWVCVNHQDFETAFRQCGRNIHGARGLPDPAFLVYDDKRAWLLRAGERQRRGAVVVFMLQVPAVGVSLPIR